MCLCDSEGARDRVASCLYCHQQFSTIQGEGEERSTDLVHLSGDIVYLVADGRPSSKIELYVLKQDVSAATKKARAMWHDLKTIKAWLFPDFTQKLGGWSIF